MRGRFLCATGVRRQAVKLFERRFGRKLAAPPRCVRRGAVGKWLETCRSVGMEVLAEMSTIRRAYTFETKVAAVKAVIDEGLTKPEAMAKFKIVSSSSLKSWLKSYREGGAEALKPKPKGRPKGARTAPRTMTHEQELERRVQELEAENAYLKKSIALKARKRLQTAKGQRS